MRSKLLIAAVGAALAFLLATNPVVVQAAGSITSGDIKNNSIKGRDVKDNKLTGKDVRESTLGVVPDARKLAGQAASAYRNNAHRFRLPNSGTPSVEKTFSFPSLSAGNHIFSYSIVLTSPSVTSCSVRANRSSRAVHEGFAYSTRTDGAAVINGSGAIEVSGAGPILRCTNQGDEANTLYPGLFPSTVVFTRVDALTEGSATLGRG